mmetsp:Transcript_35306/g.79802  ORF Transcript_35306/g.79802 Transcript_35306/m.79802 type:complete len:226 (-) Transcript_35306:5-682(-)
MLQVRGGGRLHRQGLPCAFKTGECRRGRQASECRLCPTDDVPGADCQWTLLAAQRRARGGHLDECGRATGRSGASRIWATKSTGLLAVLPSDGRWLPGRRRQRGRRGGRVALGAAATRASGEGAGGGPERAGSAVGRATGVGGAHLSGAEPCRSGEQAFHSSRGRRSRAEGPEHTGAPGPEAQRQACRGASPHGERRDAHEGELALAPCHAFERGRCLGGSRSRG